MLSGPTQCQIVLEGSGLREKLPEAVDQVFELIGRHNCSIPGFQDPKHLDLSSPEMKSDGLQVPMLSPWQQPARTVCTPAPDLQPAIPTVASSNGLSSPEHCPKPCPNFRKLTSGPNSELVGAIAQWTTAFDSELHSKPRTYILKHSW